jgi:hypothetical protein
MTNKQSAFLVIVEWTKTKSKVKIYDGAQELDIDKPLAEGVASHWRGAIGQALEQIELKTGEENESE